MSFTSVPQAPVDPIFGTALAYEADPAKVKINLGVGAYRTNEGQPWVLPCVRAAEQRILQSNFNHEYLPIDGLKDLQDVAASLILGDFYKQNPKKVVSFQSLSGTGALRLGSAFISKWMQGRIAYIPNPTWGNHKSVFSDSGLKSAEYRYFDSKTLGLNISGMLEDLRNAPEGSIILLHACAHNPTGVDPSMEQWKEIATVMAQKKLFPFFDCAYQGFATGSLERDRAAIEYFANEGFELLIAQSFAKNFGMYGERIGCFHVVCQPDTSEPVRSQLKLIARAMYSNPPAHGARVVTTVVRDPALFQEWKDNLKTMSGRIFQVRQLLYDELKKLGTPGTWEHILHQIGMFTYTGLSESQCERLTKEFHVYLLKSGRISMAGINTNNVAYLAKAIHEVVVGSKL
uniref:Aspartate aminotransferase n=1 Tax=Arcella intermedia TaxID=1963864 RepID=A0A6B2L604_9EUKA